MAQAARARRPNARRARSSDLVFRALADPTRRNILALLRKERQSVGELSANFRMSRPAVSKHLRLLRDAGLVVDRSEGTSRICELNATPLRAIDDWLGDYKAFWDVRLHKLKALVEQEP